jgi:aerobic C4-dicarboxylate transport protein
MHVDSSNKKKNTAVPRPLLVPLWLQVAIGILLGIVIGILFPGTAVTLKPFGDGFISLIRMTLAPIILAQ